jgi:UDP-3-O-[3-hydroxymyristoyl] N-acetylglucosamine deacetylase/3-hydroxyacyl-[acyl-carrier-protein] dehydratase
LRFEDELVRHKILDLIGDLYLLGISLKAKITAQKAGHMHNINFLKKIIDQDTKTKEEADMFSVNVKIGKPLGISEIQKIIPHRYPFLFIDKVVITEEEKKAVGYKAVSGNEEFFQGHFPGNPIMPGVLVIEAMAQTSCVLYLSRPNLADKVAYFMSIENAKFRKPVLPGDYLELRIEIMKARERFGKVKGKAYVAGNLVAEAEFSFVTVDKGE